MRYRPETVAFLTALLPAPAVLAAPDTERLAELESLLVQDCGSCHGLTLQGGLGPPLVPATMAARPGEVLLDAIMNGRPGTAMPPWRGLLTVAEARWLVERLQAGVTP